VCVVRLRGKQEKVGVVGRQRQGVPTECNEPAGLQGQLWVSGRCPHHRRHPHTFILQLMGVLPGAWSRPGMGQALYIKGKATSCHFPSE
jgi:hypothetical protein